MATMRQIAKHAGVSPSTVSRVINKNAPVKEAARNKVLAAIRQLEAGDIMKGKCVKGNVGIVLPTSSARNLATHPSLYATVLSFIDTVSSHSIGNTTILLDEHTDLASLHPEEVCGYLILGTNDHEEENLLPLMSESGLPFVFINRLMGNLHASCVNIDDAQATELAVNYLLGLGHKRIAFLGGNENFPNTKIRCASYKHTITDAGVAFDEELVLYGDYSEQSGAEMADRLLTLSKLPTAVCAASDSIAIGFMHRLSERGINVPEDISVIGFGNIEASAYISPALSTIAQNSMEMGRIAALTLIQLMENSCIYSQQVLIRTALVVRESCSPPRKVERP